MNTATLETILLEELRRMHGEQYRRASSAAAKLAERLGYEPRHGTVTDGAGESHVHSWAVGYLGHVVDPLREQFPPPLRYHPMEA